MPYKSTGTAGKSSTGASMSKYDVEVEARLQKLEAAVTALESHSHQSSGGDVTTDSFNDLKQRLKEAFPGQFKDL